MYRAAIEAQVPAEKRAELRVTVSGTNRASQELTYGQIVRELEAFEEGIPECSSCPVGGGRPLGCYRYVTYPVDGAFEQLLFDFFVEQLKTPDSIGDQIYRDVVSKQPAQGSSWHLQRGAAEKGGLATLGRPLVHTWGGFFSRRSVDSAQMLASLFMTIEHPAAVVGYGLFLAELVEFGKSRGVTKQSATFQEVEHLVPLYLATAPYALEGNGFVLVDG
ncbi:MAG TPA: hypothetical protein VLT33_05885 [Labilithrix sp.]|nr:hypothetical protein [Labilithrix sp.]